MKYLYGIIDAKTGKQIHKDLQCKTVADYLDIDSKVISWYAQSNRPIKGKYIIPVIQSQTVKTTVHVIYPLPEAKYELISADFTRRWNNMVAAARLLKTGHGKIVTKNGVKYVEATL